MTTIAIMQPYFAPYLGYFRLMEMADIFVIYDCVQFTRRGWIHRNKLENQQQNAIWLTLPLKKQPQQTLIRELEFRDDAQQAWEKRRHSFQHIVKTAHSEQRKIWQKFSQLQETPLQTIVEWLQYSCHLLDIQTQWVYSSSLDIPPSKKGSDRIIEIVKQLGGTQYINAPNGVGLYNKEEFQEQGIDLQFLVSYEGMFQSILQRFITEEQQVLRTELLSNCRFQ